MFTDFGGFHKDGDAWVCLWVKTARCGDFAWGKLDVGTTQLLIM
jgi:hypothetical protein